MSTSKTGLVKSSTFLAFIFLLLDFCCGAGTIPGRACGLSQVFRLITKKASRRLGPLDELDPCTIIMDQQVFRALVKDNQAGNSNKFFFILDENYKSNFNYSLELFRSME